MSKQTLLERMRKIALDLPEPDDMTNREYWLRTEILEWADAFEAKLSKTEQYVESHPSKATSMKEFEEWREIREA